MVDGRTMMLIAGSANATPAMIAYTEQVVARAIECGHFIYVGDNPRGVDRAVVESVFKAGYPDYAILGIPNEFPRVLRAISGHKVKSAGQFTDYHGRDVCMIDMCDEAFFIWNGNSAGTKAGFDYALRIGRVSYLATFKSGSNRPTITTFKGEK